MAPRLSTLQVVTTTEHSERETVSLPRLYPHPRDTRGAHRGQPSRTPSSQRTTRRQGSAPAGPTASPLPGITITRQRSAGEFRGPAGAGAGAGAGLVSLVRPVGGTAVLIPTRAAPNGWVMTEAVLRDSLCDLGNEQGDPATSDDEATLLSPSEVQGRGGRDLGDQYFGEAVYRRMCRKCKINVMDHVIRSLQRASLEVRHRCLGPPEAKALAVTLVSNSFVTHLDLGKNRIGPKGGEYIADLLRENIFLNQVDVSDNDIGDRGVGFICEAMAENDTCTRLKMAGNGLTDHSSVGIRQLLIRNSSLRELDLSRNKLGVHSGTTLARALATNCTLKVLDLSWNHLRLKGAQQLCLALGDNACLEKVNFAFNGLSTEGCIGLQVALAENDSLQELDLSNNRIHGAALKVLLTGLARNETLRVLRIGDNPIPREAAKSLLDTLQQAAQSALRELDLTHVVVDTPFLETLETLQGSRDLHVVHDVIYRRAGEVGDDEWGRGRKAEDPMLLLLRHAKEKNMRLMDIFHSFDGDNSMTLDRREFIKGLEKAKINLSLTELDDLLERLDLNGDGEIDFRELLQGHKKVKRKLLAQLQEERRAMSQLSVDGSLPRRSQSPGGLRLQSLSGRSGVSLSRVAKSPLSPRTRATGAPGVASDDGGPPGGRP